MDATANLNLPFLMPAQAQKHVTHNEALRALDAIVQLTVDGVMQGPGGAQEDPSGGFTRGGWAMNSSDEGVGRAIRETIAGQFDLLLGRRTYDIWTGYWPLHEDNPIGAAFKQATKYVVTHRDGLTWPVSHALGGDIVGADVANSLARRGIAVMANQQRLTGGFVQQLGLVRRINWAHRDAVDPFRQ